LHEAQHAPARAVPVQVGVVAADQSGFLQLPHAPPAGRGDSATRSASSPTVARPSCCRAWSRLRSMASSSCWG
jgi:hypothetical protein